MSGIRNKIFFHDGKSCTTIEMEAFPLCVIPVFYLALKNWLIEIIITLTSKGGMRASQGRWNRQCWLERKNIRRQRRNVVTTDTRSRGRMWMTGSFTCEVTSGLCVFDSEDVLRVTQQKHQQLLLPFDGKYLCYCDQGLKFKYIGYNGWKKQNKRSQFCILHMWLHPNV